MLCIPYKHNSSSLSVSGIAVRFRFCCFDDGIFDIAVEIALFRRIEYRCWSSSLSSAFSAVVLLVVSNFGVIGIFTDILFRVIIEVFQDVVEELSSSSLSSLRSRQFVWPHRPWRLGRIIRPL